MFGIPLAFGAPAILGALLALPLIWWLLKLTPPRPKQEAFPPLKVLASVLKREETPSKSPWWLTLLRMLMGLPPAIAGDWIFTLTDEAKLLCIAKANGKVRWMTPLARYRNEKKKKNPIQWTGPVLAGNRLWMANSRGEIMVGSVTDGTVSPFAKLGSGVSLAPVIANQTLYFLDDGGIITAFR